MMDKNISRVIQTFILTDKMHHATVDKKMASIGIHRSQHLILMFLAQNRDARISQKDIADNFHISPAAVAVTLKKLEAGGYITKTVLETDNRVNTINITDKALALVEKTMAFSDELEQYVFKDFSPQELEIFCACLEKMQLALQSYDEQPERMESL